MSTYCSDPELRRYVQGGISLDSFSVEDLIQRSEGDLDLIVTRAHSELPPTQVIYLGSGTTVPSSGTFTLSWNGNVTTALQWDATAPEIESALEALAGVGSDTNLVSNVDVLGGNPFTVVWSLPWARANWVGKGSSSVDFQVPLISVNAGSLVPGNLPIQVVEVMGRKINPLTDIDRNQQIALSNACCAQAEYRNAMGPRFFVRPQYRSVKGPDFQVTGKRPWISPKARRELSQNGLIQVSGRAFAGRGRTGVGRGQATY